MACRNGDAEWPCFVYYKLPDERAEQRYQGAGYRGDEHKRDGEGGFLITHGSSPEELAGRMRDFVQGMANWQNVPLWGSSARSEAAAFSPDEEKRFFERLGISPGKKE